MRRFQEWKNLGTLDPCSSITLNLRGRGRTGSGLSSRFTAFRTSAARMRKPWVLVVDDDPLMRALISLWADLQRVGSMTAGSVDEAWAILESDAPSIIVTDMRMDAGESGAALKARGLPPEVHWKLGG